VLTLLVRLLASYWFWAAVMRGVPYLIRFLARRHARRAANRQVRKLETSMQEP
jgi:hypothetical protein